MDEHILSELVVATRNLLTLNLRGKVNIIARLYPYIIRANKCGYTHESIHKSLQKAGLDITLVFYHNLVYRAKLKINKGDFEAIELGSPTPIIDFKSTQPSTKFDDSNIQKIASELGQTENNTSATQLVNTLQDAVKVGAKDYSKAAMDLLNSQRKNK